MIVELLNAAATVLEAAKMKKASLKSLIYDSHYREKGRLSAVTMETQRHLPIIEKLIEETGAHESKALSECLLRVVTYELLFGKGLGGRDGGSFRKAIRPYQRKMKDSLKKLKEDLGASDGKELLEKFGLTAKEDPMPRWVRVNLLKTTVEEVEEMFRADGLNCILSRRDADDLVRGKDANTISSLLDEYVNSLQPWQFMSDLHLPDVLVFYPTTPLFNHILTEDKRIILMDKASCIPARVLAPPNCSHVIDSCAAPGNKTNHLSCLMQNTGKVFAFDMDEKRAETLRGMTEKSGCTNVEAQCADFLEVDPDDPKYSKVTHILVDPSCSGSGIVSRKDHLTGEVASRTRLKLLRGLQLRILNHAMRFPAAERVIYSTCSVHRAENEEVVWRIMQANVEFELEKVLPSWHHRPTKARLGHDGDPGDKDENEDDHYEKDYYEQDVNYTHLREQLEQEISEKCLRASFEVDKTNGFFVALFKRSRNSSVELRQGEEHEIGGETTQREDVNDNWNDDESAKGDEAKEEGCILNCSTKNDMGAARKSRKRTFSGSPDEDDSSLVKEEDSAKKKKKKKKREKIVKGKPFSTEDSFGDVKHLDNLLEDAKITPTDDAGNNIMGDGETKKKKKKKKQKHKCQNAERDDQIDEPSEKRGNDDNGASDRMEEIHERLGEVYNERRKEKRKRANVGEPMNESIISTEVEKNVTEFGEKEGDVVKSGGEDAQSTKKKKKKKKVKNGKDVNGVDGDDLVHLENQEKREEPVDVELKQREDDEGQRRKKKRKNKNEEEAGKIAINDDVGGNVLRGSGRKVKKMKRSKDEVVGNNEVVSKEKLKDEYVYAVGDRHEEEDGVGQRIRKKKKKKTKDVKS